MSELQEPTTYIAIEGNIGAGKTSLCKRLISHDPRYKLLEEELNPLLPHFYENPVKYAFTLQWNMLQSRIYQFKLCQVEKQLTKDKFHLNDRCVVGDYVFAIYNFLLGNLSPQEMDVYEETLKGNLNNLTSIPYIQEASQFIFINIEPEICKHRVENLRKNPYENAIELGYYVGLDDVYFHLMCQLLKSRLVHVLVLNNDRDSMDYAENVRILDAHLKSPQPLTWQMYEYPGSYTPFVENKAYVFKTEQDVMDAYRMIKKINYFDKVVDKEYVAIPDDIMFVKEREGIRPELWDRYQIPFYHNEYKRVVMWLLSQGIKIYLYKSL